MNEQQIFGNVTGAALFFGLYLICAGLPLLGLRRTHAKRVRTALIRTGIPLCIKCCYDREGTEPEAEVCPECGTQFTENLRDLLASLSPDAADDA